MPEIKPLELSNSNYKVCKQTSWLQTKRTKSRSKSPVATAPGTDNIADPAEIVATASVRACGRVLWLRWGVWYAAKLDSWRLAVSARQWSVISQEPPGPPQRRPPLVLAWQNAASAQAE